MSSSISDFKSYNGNPNLKRHGVGVNWTPEMVHEYMKCSTDIVYFVKTYMKIVNVDRGLINFEPYDYQIEMLKAMSEERYTIIATSRQSGKCVSADTTVKIKFLDSPSQTLKIKTIHEMFILINRYRSSYLFGRTYENLGQQIYQNILLSDSEEAKRFIRMWGRASYHSKKSWWKEYTRESSDTFVERTLLCPSSFEQDVYSEYSRTQENDSCTLVHVTDKRSRGNKVVQKLCLAETEICGNAIRINEGGGKSFFWKDMGYRSPTPKRFFGKNSYTGTEISHFKFDEAALVAGRESSETLEKYAEFGESKGSQSTKDRRKTDLGIERKKKFNTKSKIQDKYSSFQGSSYYTGTEGEIEQGFERANKVSGDKTENERSLENKKTKFIESIELKGFKVKSDSGWVELYQSHKTVKFKRWTLRTRFKELLCADDHIVFDANYNELYVKDLQVGMFIQTDIGLDEITAVFETDIEENMYDLGVDHHNHRYYTDGILSHNSTTTCAYILWYILFQPDKTVALLANKAETAREILGKIQLAYEHLPKWLQQGVIEWNKGSFVLENNSRVLATATSSNNIRGFSINLLFIDEAAFIDNWDTFFTSVYPTISSGKTTQIILVSTPNGLNHFYKTWQNAQEGRNGYRSIKVVWNQVPGRDDNWRRDTLAAMNFDVEKFSQEYEVEFLGSSGTLIAGWKLKELVHKTPLFEKDGLRQYETPKPGRSYVCIADVSRGKGLDYSAFSIVDVTEMPYSQVCIFRNNLVTPIDYADIIHRVCKSYNSAATLVEINDIGEQVATSLHYDFEYENVLFTESAGRSGKRITSGFGANIDQGIRTTKSVKSVGCSILKLLIEQNQLIVNDFDTISELSTFSRKGVSYEAESGKHDDLVMGLVLFAWLSDQMYFKELTSINTLAKLREKTDEEIAQDLVPFGFVDNGMMTDEVIEAPRQGNWFAEVEDPF